VAKKSKKRLMKQMTIYEKHKIEEASIHHLRKILNIV
jgi:hypothetical protein